MDLATIIASVIYASNIAMQGVKPLIETLPGIMLPQNQQAHDWLLRIVMYAINFGVLIALQHTPVTSAVLANLQWYDLVGIAFGQAVFSHATYAINTTGKVDAPAPVSAGGPSASGTSGSFSVTTGGLPIVPRI